MSSPSEQTLIVTGANGFVAGHIVKAALDKGYHVRGTCRSKSSCEKVEGLFENSERLTMSVVPDITNVEDYKSAFQGTVKPITGVINVAAPFVLHVEDNIHDLLEPAVEGAKGILHAVKLYGRNVKRVVSTSSFASIVDISKGYRPGYTYTEKDWNPMTKEEAAKADNTTAYCCSKALAERALWDFIETEQPEFDAVCLCPPWVFGPHIDAIHDLDHLNESSHLIWNLVGADAVPPVDFGGFCDARTLAKAHISAFETPEASNRRFLCGTRFTYQTAVDIIRRDMPQLRARIPAGEAGSGETQPLYKMDGSTAERVLGISYIPLETTMKDMMEQLLKAEKEG